MIEQWKKVDGINYEISSFGRFRNLKSGHTSYGSRIKKYNALRVSNQPVFYMHRLVGKHFIPNPYNLPEINHKDCNPQNNHVDNLEWSTRKDNVVHAHRTLRFKHKFPLITEIEITKLYQVYGLTYREISKLFGCEWGSIRKVVDRFKGDLNLYATL